VSGTIELERDDRGIVTIWLNDPKRYNALGDEMVRGLIANMNKLAGDNSVRAIVLRGRNGVFCAGRNLSDLQKLQSSGFDNIKTMYDDMQRINEVIYYSPHPTVAVVEKYALGIATMIASWADITIGESGTLMGFPEVQHGITPYGAAPSALNVMSPKKAADLLITGRKITAVEAVEYGLITRAVPASELAKEYDKVIADIMLGNPAAIRKTKQFMRDCEHYTFQQGMSVSTDKAIAGIGMPELSKGLDAFLNKKPKNWS
jgi:enoyl-CoA hydratase/carnithine racemase